jgi:rod shape-determining protein MreC
MRKLLDIIRQFRDYFLLIALVIVSLTMVSNSDINRLGGYRSFVIASIGKLQEFFSWVPNPAALQSENRSLRELNLYLSTEVMKNRTAQLKNEKFRKMLDFKDKADIPMLSAEVVGKSVIEMRNYITIDRGSNDGVQQGMIVRTDAGLVGMVIAAESSYSLVEVIKNRHVKVSSKVLRNGIGGILAWTGNDYFELKNIPSSFDIVQGDILVSSEYTNKYPADVPIGIISKVSNKGNSLFQHIEVKAFADYETLEQVFVVLYIPNPEKNNLVMEMEKRLQLLKK